MREQFPDFVTWGKVNGAVINIRKRFDSYRTLVTTLNSAAGSDGAIALAQSMISHISLISDWLEASVLAPIEY